MRVSKKYNLSLFGQGTDGRLPVGLLTFYGLSTGRMYSIDTTGRLVDPEYNRCANKSKFLFMILRVTSTSSRCTAFALPTSVGKPQEAFYIIRKCISFNTRAFSSASDVGGRGDGGRGRGGGGRGGRGNNRYPSKGGRGSQSWYRDNNSSQQTWKKYNNDKDNLHKQNFTQVFLEPAARGELKKHQSSLPKLANRKGKGHGVRGADPFWESEVNDQMGVDGEDGLMAETESFFGDRGGAHRNDSRGNQVKTGTIAAGSKLEDLNPEEYQEVSDFIQLYNALAYIPDKEEYYWNEIDYENDTMAKKEALFDKLMDEATHDADGNLFVEVDDETFAMMKDFEEKGDEKKDDDRTGQPINGRSQQLGDDIYRDFEFVMDAMGIKSNDKPPNPETYDAVTPLALKGPSVLDFVESMMEHPTKFGQVRLNFPHPESKREPVPDLPMRRRNPPPEFMEGNARFIYVWGLPPLGIDNQPRDLSNPVHAMEVQKLVASLFDLQPQAVYASTVSSAFVGFPSRADQRFALEAGPMEPVIVHPVIISKYMPKEGDKNSFAEEDINLSVLLENLPEGHSPASLAETLFPSDLEVGLVFGDRKPEDFVMLTPHSAVLRFESAEKAESALLSSLVEQRLQELGRHRIRYSKARRSLVYTGKHTGPLGTEPERILGNQLIVDGDMPKKSFFLSHSMTLHLRNLDPSLSKQDISDFFKSCCALPRDVEGSIEFVTCYRGLSTGKAYVGFDQHGEAEAAMSLCSSGGRLSGLGRNNVIVKRVREASKIAREKRPAREEKDLLDSLDNWEQFVDPKDLEELYVNGIAKEALDEALRAIRYHNPTFSSLDQAMRSETLNPEKEVGGMYRELVQSYVATLKECISTPKNPGVILEQMHHQDEPISTELFDREPIRQAALKKRRDVP
jgi:hypothetical protein